MTKQKKIKKGEDTPTHSMDGDGICRPWCALCLANLRAGLSPDGSPRVPGQAYLLQNREGYWWRPNAQGYTAHVEEAGVFSEHFALGYLDESYRDRQERVCLARPHLERAQRKVMDRLEASIRVESGSDSE